MGEPLKTSYLCLETHSTVILKAAGGPKVARGGGGGGRSSEEGSKQQYQGVPRPHCPESKAERLEPSLFPGSKDLLPEMLTESSASLAKRARFQGSEPAACLGPVPKACFHLLLLFLPVLGPRLPVTCHLHFPSG